MLNIFKKMDFWSGMIVLGIVLSLGLGAWYLEQNTKFKKALRAFNASRTLLPQIESLITDLDGLIKAKEANAGEIDNIDAGAYLQAQFVNANIPGGRFTVSGADKQRKQDLKIDGKTRHTLETEVTLNFNKPVDKRIESYSRKQIYWAIFNAERNSKRWRLRYLTLSAEELKSKSRRKQGLPDELNDNWFIERMVFVSRQPVTTTRK